MAIASPFPTSLDNGTTSSTAASSATDITTQALGSTHEHDVRVAITPNTSPPLRRPESLARIAQTHARTPHRSTLRSVLIVLTCTTAMIVNSSNISYVSIAVPTISRDLGIPESQLQWVVSAYSLSSGCLLLMFGRLADLYGRKKTFIIGSSWLAAFSMGCGFANNSISLDILRGLQGIGAAATIPASLGILAHSFPPSKARSVAFATFAAGAPVGSGLGMALGGALTELTRPTWRSNFFVFAGLTVLSALGGIASMDADVPSLTESDRRVDWIGSFLVTAGLVLIVFILSQGEEAPQKWATPYIIALLIVGVILLGLFGVWQAFLEAEQGQLDTGGKNEMRPTSSSHGLRANLAAFLRRKRLTPPPLMKISLWSRARGRFAAVMWIAIFNWCAFRAWGFWIQLYYQDYAGYSPVRTMVRLLPMFVTGILCNFVVANVVGRVPVIYLIVMGTLVTATASLLFAIINPEAPYWAFGFPSAICSVFGADFVFAAGTIFVAKVVHPHEQSLAGGVFQTMTQLGTALGIPVSTIVFNRVVAQDSRRMGIIVDATGSNAPPQARLNGYRAAQWTAFAFGILATILAVIFLRNIGIVGHEGGPRKYDAEETIIGQEELETHKEKTEGEQASA
ncbi:hypothetical protein HGRIS_009791 [Hohenbuehelia grisea]|uniref:Major facilitator superfamily (MFS) profile domain-containing protein n=1 Tax=Hohenbuehelia grisea TaxID=104357 RepID=A0ABR3J2N2_9AGAR